MFGGHWAVDGDHSGTNNQFGNLPPAKNDNGGYMLLVNADFVASEAYRQTITNLCPNTYYEFSAWFRNVCTNCGADSLGRQFNTLMPVALQGGYPGVLPNLSFSVDGLDHYSTGEISPFDGWVKRGFVIRTGPTQTSATFSIRNNSQGGGGNDWAMDDISVSTCLPTMRYSPSNNPTLCMENPFVISDTIRSIYNTYTNYKWQRSVNGGSTWTDITAPAVGTPVYNGSEYQYVISYSLTPSQTQLSNNGDMYRVIVSTTAANLSNSSCNFTDGSAIISLNVIDCAPILNVKLVSFDGKLQNGKASLKWKTSQETATTSFEVERSFDGVNFYRVAMVNGQNNLSSLANQYAYSDSSAIPQKAFYRIALLPGNGRRIQSHTILLQKEQTEEFSVNNLINPFRQTVTFDLVTSSSSKVTVTLLDAAGHVVKAKAVAVAPGLNTISLAQSQELANGVYILKIQQNEKAITRKVIKQ